MIISIEKCLSAPAKSRAYRTESAIRQAPCARGAAFGSSIESMSPTMFETLGLIFFARCIKKG
jgi:hypothetical protein